MLSELIQAWMAEKPGKSVRKVVLELVDEENAGATSEMEIARQNWRSTQVRPGRRLLPGM
jgi:hypothetical protein